MLINLIVTVKKKRKDNNKKPTKTKQKTKQNVIPENCCVCLSLFPHFKVSLKRQKGRLLKWAAIYF